MRAITRELFGVSMEQDKGKSRYGPVNNRLLFYGQPCTPQFKKSASTASEGWASWTSRSSRHHSWRPGKRGDATVQNTPPNGNTTDAGFLNVFARLVSEIRVRTDISL